MANEIDKYNGEIIIYQTPDGQTQIDVRMENETVWLIQARMAELFETDRTSIVRHINNIYNVEELDRESTCAKIAQVQVEGKRTVLTQLWKLCFTGADKDLNIAKENVEKAQFKESADKIRRMYESATANGFTSFAEA